MSTRLYSLAGGDGMRQKFDTRWIWKWGWDEFFIWGWVWKSETSPRSAPSL